jgi:hypothetical protein
MPTSTADVMMKIEMIEKLISILFLLFELFDPMFAQMISDGSAARLTTISLQHYCSTNVPDR